MSTKYKVGSLFAGVGGVCLGFKNASYKEKEYEMILHVKHIGLIFPIH